MFGKKWKLRKNIIKEKKKENEKFIVEIEKEQYKDLIECFPLNNNVEFFSEKKYDICSNGVIIDVFDLIIQENYTEIERRFKILNDYDEIIKENYFEKVKFYFSKKKKEKKYKLEKLEYLDYVSEKPFITVECINNIPQFQKNNQLILLHSVGKTNNPDICEIWKKKDEIYSRIFTKYEYIENFRYKSLYNYNGFCIYKQNNGTYDWIDFYEGTQYLNKTFEALKKLPQLLKNKYFSFYNTIGNNRELISEKDGFKHNFFQATLENSKIEEFQKNFKNATGKNYNEIEYQGRLLDNFSFVEVKMKPSNVEKLEINDETEIKGAYPIEIRFLKSNLEEVAKINFDNYGIASFEGFEEVITNERGTFGVIYKNNLLNLKK